MRRFIAALIAGALTVGLAAGRAEERVAIPLVRDGETLRLDGYLTSPEGRGSAPAVVLMHSCLGLPSNRAAIGARLARAGYAALFVDEFSARGLAQTCSRDFPEGLADAEAARAFLARRANVDPDRIAIAGFSQGAGVALEESAAGGAGFRAAVAFYAPCANLEGRRLKRPTLILVGAEDSVTPAADCAALARANPARARLVVYRGAGHVFDDPQFAGGAERLGMRLVYDAPATRRAYADMQRFLDVALGR